MNAFTTNEYKDPVIRISLDLLEEENPLDIDYWADGDREDENSLREEVERAIQDQRFNPAPKTLKKSPTDYGTKFHAERIAWFVVNGWEDPIFIDVGVPSLGYSPLNLVADGSHRLAAAFYRGDTHIDITWAGCHDSFESFLKGEFLS